MNSETAARALAELCRDIESGQFLDPLGHEAEMLASYKYAVSILERLKMWPPPPRILPNIPLTPADEL